MPQSKVQYVRNVQSVAARLSSLLKDAIDLDAAYFHRGYNAGGGDPITTAELQSELPGITAEEVAAGITLLQQFENFMNNQAVVQGDYAMTADTLRDDY